MTEINLVDSFKAVGVAPDDIAMIHADAGVAAQYMHVERAQRLNKLIKELIEFMEEGTVIVPTFSYSFTKKENFDREMTPSDVGLFSERFRKTDGVERSSHPIFSIAVRGKDRKEFLDSSIEDCFGSETYFETLRKKNAKIVCLGCSFDRVTFVHYVEQMHKISYRYFKIFSGSIFVNGKESKVQTQCFVRDTTIASECEHNLLKQVCIEKGVLKQSEIGRFPILAIAAQDFFNVASELLERQPYALIKQRLLEE